MAPDTFALHQRWALVAPQQFHLADELIGRWSEPHRHYHDLRHLLDALDAAAELGAGRPELLALWFHDAIHTGRSDDETRSAELAERLLADDPDAAEAARLVRLTAHHQPSADDAAGAIVCDADLHLLASAPERYAASVSDLRRERRDLGADDWLAHRKARIDELLARPSIFTTTRGAATWEPVAQHNLRRERERLGRADQLA